MTDSIIIVVIAIGILSFGCFNVVMTYAFDTPIKIINEQIDAGMLSKDTQEHLQLMLSLWEYSPIVFLIGLILYTFERSKGTDLTASVFFEYEALLIIAITSSVYITWAYGMSADQLFYQLESNPLTSQVLYIFDTSEMRATLIKLMYVSLCVPGFLGCLLFMIFPITRQTDTTFFMGSEGDDAYLSGDESVTQYNPLQFQ